MADLQGTRRNITEMAIVCTEKQFAKLYASDASFETKEYVRLDIKQVRGELCGGVTVGPLQPGSIAVIPKSCSAHYLALLLCSLPGQLFLFEKKFNVLAKRNINKKIVCTLTAFDVEETSEIAYSTAEFLKESAYNQYLENNKESNYELLYRLIVDLCDLLALELYAHPLFEKRGIYILENWKIELEKKKDGNTILIPMMSLLDKNSTLRNEIMKAHILIHDVNEYIK